MGAKPGKDMDEKWDIGKMETGSRGREKEKEQEEGDEEEAGR